MATLDVGRWVGGVRGAGVQSAGRCRCGWGGCFAGGLYVGASFCRLMSTGVPPEGNEILVIPRLDRTAVRGKFLPSCWCQRHVGPRSQGGGDGTASADAVNPSLGAWPRDPARRQPLHPFPLPGPSLQTVDSLRLITGQPRFCASPRRRSSGSTATGCSTSCSSGRSLMESL